MPVYEHMHIATALRQRRIQQEEMGSLPVGFIHERERLPPHQFVQVYENPDKFPPPQVGTPDGLGGVMHEPLAVPAPHPVGSELKAPHPDQPRVIGQMSEGKPIFAPMEPVEAFPEPVAANTSPAPQPAPPTILGVPVPNV